MKVESRWRVVKRRRKGERNTDIWRKKDNWGAIVFPPMLSHWSTFNLHYVNYWLAFSQPACVCVCVREREGDVLAEKHSGVFFFCVFILLMQNGGQVEEGQWSRLMDTPVLVPTPSHSSNTENIYTHTHTDRCVEQTKEAALIYKCEALALRETGTL